VWKDCNFLLYQSQGTPVPAKKHKPLVKIPVTNMTFRETVCKTLEVFDYYLAM